MRTHEIGIRMALGADAKEIFRMVPGEGLKLSMTGLAIGLVGALWLGQVISNLLFGISSTDPFTFDVRWNGTHQAESDRITIGASDTVAVQSGRDLRAA